MKTLSDQFNTHVINSGERTGKIETHLKKTSPVRTRLATAVNILVLGSVLILGAAWSYATKTSIENSALRTANQAAEQAVEKALQKKKLSGPPVP